MVAASLLGMTSASPTSDRPDDRASTPRRSRPGTYVARTPTDLVAMVPLVLGFHPRDSVVLLTFGGPRSFHARVDLPTTAADQDEVASSLARAAATNQVRSAAVLLYTEDDAAAEHQGRLLVAALPEECRVVEVLRVEDERWFSVPADGAGGTSYDLRAHPFTAQRVFEGQVVHPDRAALAHTLEGADGADRRAVLAAATAYADRLVWRVGQCTEDEARRELLAGEARWLQRVVRAHVADGALLDVADAGRTLVLLSQIQLRDVAWSELNRHNAEQHVELWRDLVRRAPDDLLPPPAAMLAFSAWQQGHGALAWCAVDRCLDQDPDYSLAGIVGDLLAGAVPPHAWEPVPPAELPVFRDAPGSAGLHSV